MIGNFPPVVGTKQERKLLKCFKSLSEENQQTLIKFAKFLADNDQGSEGSAEKSEQNEKSNKENSTSVVSTPNPIERPTKESVIKAIKRLNKTYPMIDKSTLLDRTSGLMTEHLLKGRDAVSVIDELESMFELAYKEVSGLD